MKLSSVVRMALLLLSLGGSACGIPMQVQLDDSLKHFSQAYRWKQFEQAAGFVDPETRGRFAISHQDLQEKLTVSEVGMQVIAYDEDKGEATVLMNTLSAFLPSTRAKNRTTELHWRHTDDGWVCAWPEDVP